MARMSNIQREVKRKKLVAKYSTKRKELRKASKDINLSYEERREAQAKLAKLPRDSSPSRQRTRCQFCSRPRAVNRLTGLCRIHMRMSVMLGYIPGMHKASW